MQLILMRHGLAVDREEAIDLPDADRPLTPKGARRVRKVARALRALGSAPGLVLTSSLRRAVETADIAMEAIGVRERRATEALSPGSPPERLLAELADLKVDEALCTGHAPHLDLVIAKAVSGTAVPICRLKKAGVACLDFDPTSGRGLLLWLLTPSIVRSLG